MLLSDRFLKDEKLKPKVSYSKRLNFLGTETNFAFGSLVSEVEKSKKFKQVYKFHIGDTGPNTPDPIIEVAKKALDDKQTKYGHFLGYPQVRKNIADYWSKTRKVELNENNIMLIPGGKPAIELAIEALVEEDEAVVVPDPSYSIYSSLANYYTKGNCLYWKAKKNENDKKLFFDVSDLETILNENKKVKLVFINTPQNPTGLVWPQSTLEKIADLAKKHKFIVVFDDIYDQIVFGEKKHFSILSVPGMLDYTINLNGFSKNYAMTGWRLGFVVAPEWLIEIFGQLAVNKWSCVSRVNQIVAGTIFGDMDLDGYHYESVGEKIAPILAKDFKIYEQKGKFLSSSLSLLSPYVLTSEAEGAFYLFVNFENILNNNEVKNKFGFKNDKDLRDYLLFEQGVAVLAGSDFGEMGGGYLRFSYAEDKDRHIIPGVKKLLYSVVEILEESGLNPPLSKEEIEEKVMAIAQKNF